MSRTFVALDLSTKSTGFAIWTEGTDRPRCGTWQLAPSIQWAPRAYVRLHRSLSDIHTVSPIAVIVYEDPLPPHAVHGHTSIDVLKAAAGLASHVQSFGEALGIRHLTVHQATWRRHFIGKMPRGTKTPDLKAMAMRRCRELGFDAIKHDAAEACGLLDYQLSMDGITPPWRVENALQQELIP